MIKGFKRRAARLTGVFRNITLVVYSSKKSARVLAWPGSTLIGQKSIHLELIFWGHSPEDPLAKQPIHQIYHVYQVTSEAVLTPFERCGVSN